MPHNASFETVQGMFVVSGSLDRAADHDFQTALEKYALNTPVDRMKIDMSHVRWLSPTGGKILIQIGQDVLDKGGQIHVMASRHVHQTLNLLGGKSWLNIDVISAPSTRQTAVLAAEHATPPPAAVPAAVEARAAAPVVAAPAARGAENGSGDLDSSLLDVGSASSAPAHHTPAQVLATAEKQSETPSHMEHIHIPTTVPAPKSANSSGMLSAVRHALAGPAEELSGAACLLRLLHIGRRYSFILVNGDSVTGAVRERVGGPWVLVDTVGVKKIVNLDHVIVCELL